MSRIATFFCFSALLVCAGTPWTNVKDLKNRSELLIYRKGVREPIAATFAEANDDRIVVVVKDKQIAIAKEDIDRVDARPVSAPRKVNVDSSAKETEPDLTPHLNAGSPVPGTSSSSNVSFGGGKRDFETIYQRSDGPPKN